MEMWTISACCYQWLKNNAGHTVCPECDTEFVVRSDGAVVPLHLMARSLDIQTGDHGEQD